MKILRPLVAGAVGTSFMTLYSYGYSHFRGKQFREPHLLADLLEGKGRVDDRKEFLKGWLAHYLVGAAFSLTYQHFLKGKFIKHPKAKSLLVGGLYGLLGVAGWRSTFGLHPAPPKIDYKEFYAHLVLAHLVFGYFAFGLLEKEK